MFVHLPFGQVSKHCSRPISPSGEGQSPPNPLKGVQKGSRKNLLWVFRPQAPYLSRSWSLPRVQVGLSCYVLSEKKRLCVADCRSLQSALFFFRHIPRHPFVAPALPGLRLRVPKERAPAAGAASRSLFDLGADNPST